MRGRDQPQRVTAATGRFHRERTLADPLALTTGPPLGVPVGCVCQLCHLEPLAGPRGNPLAEEAAASSEDFLKL